MDGAIDLSPPSLIEAYCHGLFPMANELGQIHWYTADPRGVIPLERFHVPGSLAQFMRSAHFPFEVRIDHDFAGTMGACMEARANNTWITPRLIDAYVRLHELGMAHSVEVWREGELAGGLYGVSIGGAFFGESMFHRQRDASKVALVHLVGRLRERGYALLDSQATTPHLSRFGCINIPAGQYLRLLKKAVTMHCTFG